MTYLLQGDCLERLKILEDNSIDSVVTDPPYGLAFMGKKWDYDVPSVEIWKEVLRVLKPGGHLLSFGGTRTYHRMVISIEDAGFEIRDQIMWIYGSGFPKSMDISKAIDKQAGAEREVVGKIKTHDIRNNSLMERKGAVELSVTTPFTESAKKWQGWGTALKPANEPICLARKPISEKTVAANVLKHGTGAMNIDECRVESKPRKTGTKSFDDEASGSGNSIQGSSLNRQQEYDLKVQGRWPANIIFDEEAGKILDEQTGERPGCKSPSDARSGSILREGQGSYQKQGPIYGDNGGASRFFYCAKTSKSERGDDNIHPTVKPIKLMTYLIKLITPPRGIVLDPFMGSGSTGVAAEREGFLFIGIERDEAYFKIAQTRIKSPN